MSEPTVKFTALEIKETLHLLQLQTNATDKMVIGELNNQKSKFKLKDLRYEEFKTQNIDLMSVSA